jgi:4-amino-4-deoxy-L-arabinose transferase-like glycosyltransferase
MGRVSALRPAVLVAVAAIVLGGAGVRGLEAAHPRLADESADERFYGALARTLSEHLNYGDRSSGPHHPFFAAPGAPLAFAAAHRLTPSPRDAPADIPAAYWLLALAGTLLIVVTFALGRELGGDAAGLAAAAAVAAYPPLVRTTGELLSEPLGALALTLAVLALVRARRSGRRAAFAAGGALLGVAALARPDLLVVIVACPLVLLTLALRSDRRRDGTRGAAIVLATGVLVLAPWVGYASLRSGYLVPIVESDAPTLMIGAFLPGDGTTQGFKRAFAAETRARNPDLRGLSDLELPGAAVIETVRARRPHLSRREALRAEASANLRRYALGRPAAFSAMMARKAWRMWRRPSQGHSPVPDMAHRVGLALALAGLLGGLFAGRRRSDLLLVSAVIVSSTLLHAVLVAHPRYAVPLIPVLVAAGASGLSALGRLAVGRGRGRLWLPRAALTP